VSLVSINREFSWPSRHKLIPPIETVILSDSSADEEPATQATAAPIPQPKKKKKRPHSDIVVDYLEKKSKVDADVRREEIEMRREELELQRKKLDLEKEKMELERKERDNRMRLEGQERQVILDFLKQKLDM
jgi:hypothetical protein